MKKLTNLQAETICDFYVDEDRKKLWNVELNMLDEVISVCKKHNIKYFLIGGSCLGAVRHKGFIPWDDDIDVGMSRDDYNKFISVASKELKKPLFLQTSLTDNIFIGIAHIRNSNTTMIQPTGEYLDCNQGIFIDIFPFDYVPDDEKEYDKLIIKLRKMANIMRYKMNNPNISIKDKIKKIISGVFFMIIPYKKYFKKYEMECSKYNHKTKRIAPMSWEPKYKCYSQKKDMFDDLIEVPFEKMKVSIPKRYDEYLTSVYGDYMKFVKGESYHTLTIVDTEKSYKNYLK